MITMSNWREYAACFGMDPELFFPVSETKGPGLDQVAEAKAVCALCPAQEFCLADALEQRDVFGVRGGLTGPERQALLRESTLVTA